MTSPTDAELVAAAQVGDAAALGALLQRHRAGMYAAVLGVLGWSPEAEDAVQDAALTALTRIGQLREPAAVGAWLRAIARNGARMRVRSATIPGEALPETLADRGPTPEQVLDRHALRNWVWTALRELSEPLQTVVLLRWFTDVTSYEQIAALCEVPVGTVRSRLSEA